uniref:PH domain-containing protein n=1 Tax=Candidatus Kentrum sp. TUN TaxID=2126343 RepID=A0A450ZSR7_9GAMM|nr:MAG: PH domain-containing protein [Candidatus Kentron sp. TUN]VFK56818.1 MAG: PH domain-containing protein [Candidatus Kentron sp. TUN]
MDIKQPYASASHLHAVDTKLFFAGRQSVLIFIPLFIKAIIPAGIAIAAMVAKFIDWNTVTGLSAFHHQIRNNWPIIDTTLTVLAWLFGFISIVFFLHGLIVWFSTQYRITSDRIEYERGILAKTILNIELWRVHDILFRRTIVHFFLGLGVIDILAADETTPKLKIGPIRGARRIYDELKKARLRSARLAGAQAAGVGMSTIDTIDD